MNSGARSDIPERTFRFAVRIVRLCKDLEKRSIAGSRMVGQLLASGTSIGANVEEAQAGLSSALSRLMVVVEKYPDIKTTDQYRTLMDQLEGTENRIQVARKRHSVMVPGE